MRMRKYVIAMAIAFAAMFGHAGDSAPFVVNNATSPSGESVILPWNAEWIGGNANATVVITDNGTEVKRTTGIGEFFLNIPCGSGTHQLEYLTFINGVKIGESYSAQAEPAHVAVETKPAKAATCIEAGWTREMKCRRCGLILEESLLVPALGGQHKSRAVSAVEPTCTEDGRTAGVMCSRCGTTLLEGEVLPALGHLGAVTKLAVEPTSSTRGLTDETTCMRCGDVLQAQTTIPALGYIRNVTARQLWPHKKVELCYEVAGDIGDVVKNDTMLLWAAQHDGTTSMASMFYGEATCTHGLHRVVWDMEADGIVANDDAMTFFVAVGDVADCGTEVAGSWTLHNAVPQAWSASENNILRGVTGSFIGARYNESGRVYNTDPISRLTDGAVNAVGTSYDNTYAIKSGTITWTFPTRVNLARLRINTHWENAGRDEVRLTSVEIQKESGSSWETLPNSSLYTGLGATSSSNLEFVYGNSDSCVFAYNAKAIRFNLGKQENDGVGFTEFEAVCAPDGTLKLSQPVAVNTSSLVCDNMSVSGTVNLGYSPFADGEVKIQIDGALAFSSTNSGVFAWQPLTTGRHVVKHISGVYEWTRVVNVTELATAGVPSPHPPTAEDPNISITQTTATFGTGGGSGSITTSGSGTWKATVSDSWITIPQALSSRNAGLPVVYQVAANRDVEPRTGYIYVSGHVFTITQDGVGAELDSYSADFEADGGDGEFTVFAGTQSGWKVRSNVDWISVTVEGTGNGEWGTAGVGEQRVIYGVAPFNEVATRSGTITAAGKMFTVKQTGRRMKLEVADGGGSSGSVSQPCQVERDYLSQPIIVNVNALSSTKWGVAVDATWMSIVDAGTGKGAGSVTLSINENPSWLARKATATIGTETIVVTQAGRPPNKLSFAIAPGEAVAPVEGANGLMSVTATPDLPWSAESGASWITVMPACRTGDGNGNVVYSVSPNPTLAIRTGKVIVTPDPASGLPAKTHNVTQPAAVASISSAEHTFDAAGESFDVQVDVADVVGWTIENGVSWITISGGTSRIGPGKVSIAVKPNMTIDSRATVLTIAGHEFSVTQAGRTVELEYTSKVFGTEPNGGSGSVEIHPNGNVSWTARPSDPSWITIWGGDGCTTNPDGSVSGTGAGTIEYILSAYNGDGSPLTGMITIGNQTVYITQRAYDYNIHPSAAQVAGNSGDGEFGVTASIGQVWNAITTEPWITIEDGYDSGTGSGIVRYFFTDNNTGKTRTGKIVIAGEEYTITQAARQLVSITVNVDGGGNACSVSGAGRYDRGSAVTLRAVAADGYEFLGWTLPNGATSTELDLNVVANVDAVYTARFRKLPYYIVNGETVREGTSLSFVAPAPVNDEAGTTKLVCLGTSRYPDKGTSFTLVVTEDVDFTWDLWRTNYLVTVNQPSGGVIHMGGSRPVATALWVESGSSIDLTAIPDSGKSFFGWNLSPSNPDTPDDPVENTSAPPASLRLCVSTPLTVSAIFGVFDDTLAEALDAPSLTFTTGGDAEWMPVIDGTANTGRSSAQSGAVGANAETWMETVLTGLGTISFRWKADCEKDVSDRAVWDRLSVFTNGVEAARMDGVTEWHKVTLPISGKTTIRWSFYRDGYDPPGETHRNCGWVDAIEWKEGN